MSWRFSCLPMCPWTDDRMRQRQCRLINAKTPRLPIGNASQINRQAGRAKATRKITCVHNRSDWVVTATPMLSGYCVHAENQCWIGQAAFCLTGNVEPTLIFPSNSFAVCLNRSGQWSGVNRRINAWGPIERPQYIIMSVGDNYAADIFFSCRKIWNVIDDVINSWHVFLWKLQTMSMIMISPSYSMTVMFHPTSSSPPRTIILNRSCCVGFAGVNGLGCTRFGIAVLNLRLTNFLCFFVHKNFRQANAPESKVKMFLN